MLIGSGGRGAAVDGGSAGENGVDAGVLTVIDAGASSGWCASGCPVSAPWCDMTQAPSGMCVGCRDRLDCAGTLVDCDLRSHTCVPLSRGSAEFGTGAQVNHCDGFDGGAVTPQNPQGGPCVFGQCGRGYACREGQCVLNGGGGPFQVTLRFSQSEDLDLHVLEPLPNGGECEIYYAQPNGPPPPPPIPAPRSCGAKGVLDLDSNAACKIDDINVENIIYSATGVPTMGTYRAKVVFYQRCGLTAAPYEVEVRASGQTRYFCGTFASTQGAGAESPIFSVTLKP